MSQMSIYMPYSKEGSGYYSSQIQAVAVAAEEATGLMLKALAKITSKKKKLYTICDYGSADGGSSMNSIRKCIAQLKKEDPGVEVHVWYEDLPTNDFKSLFYKLHGFIPEPPTYLNDFQGVYVAAIGTGFYQQCVPSNSVDLAFSSTAAHWLSKRPCNLRKTLLHCSKNDEAEVRAFKDQAAEDWETFLKHRAAELAPGGQAVLVVPAVDQWGYSTGCTEKARTPVTKTMSDAWQSMVDNGIITGEEYVNTTIDTYSRKSEEFTLPFEDKNSPVWKSGLRLLSLEIKTIQCPAQRELNNKERGEQGPADEYAAKFVNAIRVWSNHTMFSGLSELRPEEERWQIIDECFKQIEKIVADNPKDHNLSCVVAYLHIEKVA